MLNGLVNILIKNRVKDQFVASPAEAGSIENDAIKVRLPLTKSAGKITNIFSL
jgi:hypothetical protein